MLELLNKKNNFKIYSTQSDEFSAFGRALDLDTDEIISVAKNIKLPNENSIYTASEKSFENLNISKQIKQDIFGEIHAQTGYCYGHSNFLNAAEWHTSSEVNVAVTDLVLFFAHRKDIINNKIASEKFKAFFVKKGTAIEVYATTLHFCPCEVESKGFGCVVALAKGTNTDLENTHSDKLLFRKNKWILAHENNTALINRGVVAGIFGENFEVKY